MPVDQKRVNAPEVTIPYNVYATSKLEEPWIEENHSVKRKDGRTNTERRKIFLKTGIVTQAKGSAYIEMGNTKVVCSVFDPREIPNRSDYSMQGVLYCEFKFASFSCRKRRIHQQDAEEKEYSLILQRALESAVCLQEFPNFQVDIYAIVLDNQGSALAAAINAASLALANAGVPMFGLVTATTVAIYNGVNLLDPTDTEELYCNSNSLNPNSTDCGIITQATLPQHSQISEFLLVGNLSMECITNTMEVIKEANLSICPILQQCLVKSVFKAFKETSCK